MSHSLRGKQGRQMRRDARMKEKTHTAVRSTLNIETSANGAVQAMRACVWAPHRRGGYYSLADIAMSGYTTTAGHATTPYCESFYLHPLGASALGLAPLNNLRQILRERERAA